MELKFCILPNICCEVREIQLQRNDSRCNEVDATNFLIQVQLINDNKDVVLNEIPENCGRSAIQSMSKLILIHMDLHCLYSTGLLLI